VAGIWWYRGNIAPQEFKVDSRGRQITYCYLDGDPIKAAEQLGELMRRRWASGNVQGLLAAPFYCPVPYEWSRYAP
jgi:hypothetical protein